ncbi:hypothetical protein LSTR_LSTR016403 [Laodelphax striatellus]|uniref:J domain-containing protein n=1 Tax=Laodelphax striatellus TaxID=195883 RepID=A0A482X5K5_LAOST|nr:hypothetical protein LSTR_LSTR016403 [Laodelphax striatellus]
MNNDEHKRAIYDSLGVKGLETEGWEIVQRTQTPQEIREEYERLASLPTCCVRIGRSGSSEGVDCEPLQLHVVARSNSRRRRPSETGPKVEPGHCVRHASDPFLAPHGLQVQQKRTGQLCDGRLRTSEELPGFWGCSGFAR